MMAALGTWREGNRYFIMHSTYGAKRPREFASVEICGLLDLLDIPFFSHLLPVVIPAECVGVIQAEGVVKPHPTHENATEAHGEVLAPADNRKENHAQFRDSHEIGAVTA